LALVPSAVPLLSSVDDFYYLPGPIAGRDEVIRDTVQDCLAGRSTILTGVGGIGKTTVAVAVLRDPDIQARFGDRCYPVLCHELVLSDTSRIGIQLHLVKAIISSMRLPEQPRQTASAEPPSQQLAQALGRIRAQAASGPTLLYLDNMESLSEHAAGGIEEILSRLAAMPGFSFCGTSRDKSVHPEGTVCRELAPLGSRDSLAIFCHRFGCLVGLDQLEPLQEILAAMDGHPLSIILLAAYAKANEITAAITGWPRYGTVLLNNGDIKDKHGSLAATIELSLDSLDTSKDSPTRILLLFLSSITEGFPTTPDRALGIFSAGEPQAIRKLLRLSLVYVREPRHGTSRSPSRYCVLQPIAQYMAEAYLSLAAETAPDVCRGFMALLACSGRGPDLWIHDPADYLAPVSGSFTACVCDVSAAPRRGIGDKASHAFEQSSFADLALYDARLSIQGHVVRAILLKAPHLVDAGRVGGWEFGGSLLNLALIGAVRTSVSPPGMSDDFWTRNLCFHLEELAASDL
jgi:hypothetical protein